VVLGVPCDEVLLWRLRMAADPIIATAILDRLLHHSTAINIREGAIG
jgi:hypothetical protein